MNVVCVLIFIDEDIAYSLCYLVASFSSGQKVIRNLELSGEAYTIFMDEQLAVSSIGLCQLLYEWVTLREKLFFVNKFFHDLIEILLKSPGDLPVMPPLFIEEMQPTVLTNPMQVLKNKELL